MLEVGTELWALEAKLTSAPRPGDLARLDSVAELIGAERRFLVSQTPEPSGDDTRASHNLGTLLEVVAARFGS